MSVPLHFTISPSGQSGRLMTPLDADGREYDLDLAAGTLEILKRDPD
ncbi:MAG: hypothetical protein JNK47_14065 [Mesorhizobium sp.]|nr:hypothetical protein [Mesorhizobium sp.]MBL8578346.1 hypothetical protein [Mesorhizobium sp.]